MAQIARERERKREIKRSYKSQTATLFVLINAIIIKKERKNENVVSKFVFQFQKMTRAASWLAVSLAVIAILRNSGFILIIIILIHDILS